QSEAAAARAAAEEADAQAARATRAASAAQSLAATAATAARAARDAADSAANHADKAADAADEAAKYAGQAVDYANRATQYAADAKEAADAAVKAVADAQAVEQQAREAEQAKIDQHTEQGMDEARRLAAIEQQDVEAARNQLTQSQAQDSATRDLIAQAENALTAGDEAAAVVAGRTACVNLLASHGTWTREAAEYALANDDQAVLAWIDTDRILAQNQDDRETVLYLAQISTVDVAEAAQQALQSTDTGAPTAFLTTGMVEAAKDDNLVALFRILGKNPGAAVRKAAEDALAAGSAKAVHDFFATAYGKAQQEDDKVAVLSVLSSAGPYTKMAAEVAAEGPDWMRRDFLTTIHPRMVQLDADAAAHIGAIRASLAHAAKVAQDAQTDAAEASRAAAEARDAADEATWWADAAEKSATQAAEYAEEADANADAAEQSAKDADASAATAKSAALAARSAARRANYSANRATASASAAVQSANDAQASATAARASATQAGKDAKAAAQAASEARQVAAAKRKAEQEAAAKAAAEAARKAKEGGVDPADTSDNDKVDHPGTFLGGTKDDWRDVANVLSAVSSISGGVAAASLLVPPPLGEAISGIAGSISLVTGVASAVITGFTDGWTSKAFLTSAAGVAVGVLTGGVPFTKFGGVSGIIDWGAEGLRSAPIIAARLEQEVISPAIGVFTTSWDKATDTVGSAVSDTWHALTPW
ncbi:MULTISPECIES: ALF repeat-containing protein, partial [unclassified Streptomyces]|uniref:ALF repeat-containing protein n=1 Tax=unclassified Streptomyces TaxID=2593676 RepID=UPI0023D90696